MPKCSFKFCKNLKPTNPKNDAIVYFRFPSRLIRREKWIEVTRRQRKEPCFEPNTGSLVCSKHFDKSDMYTTDKGKLRLRDTAVPIIDTVNLNASIVEDKCEVDDSFLTSEVISKPSNDLVYQYSIKTNESNEEISTKMKINTSELDIQFDESNTKCSYENPFLPSTSSESSDDSEDIGKIIKIEIEESSDNSDENEIESIDDRIEADIVRTLDFDKFGEHVAAMLKRIPVHKALQLQPRILELITSVMNEDQTKIITIKDKLFDEHN
ncbi:PREDICTED: uncharacterized protein LOC106105106 isoform X1 [Papilio polytes]|uniref:uncharacterized protein LOC106105106 isoform X1 n=1 Tax=Papilio polytes TaxID=76194 RepID=UPI0006767053|nr:PREDICTED: uncharacterized protein LOC106105106 isoform X1 [Papilio polytes]